MGINGSSTCTLALGANGTCRGWLVGEEHNGISIMFLMMNEARIGVGAQGVAIATAAYGYALAYAKERLQGSSIEEFRNADAARVPITVHPDVRRMLMTMKVLSETSRSLLYRLGARHDIAESDPEQHEKLNGRVELLTPILKAHCTDIGFEVAAMGVQVMGGYGYIGEYPMEQLVRDAKIMSVYEGTNGIQAMDLIGRKLRMKNGALVHGVDAGRTRRAGQGHRGRSGRRSRGDRQVDPGTGRSDHAPRRSGRLRQPQGCHAAGLPLPQDVRAYSAGHRGDAAGARGH